MNWFSIIYHESKYFFLRPSPSLTAKVFYINSLPKCAHILIDCSFRRGSTQKSKLAKLYPLLYASLPIHRVSFLFMFAYEEISWATTKICCSWWKMGFDYCSHFPAHEQNFQKMFMLECQKYVVKNFICFKKKPWVLTNPNIKHEKFHKVLF